MIADILNLKEHGAGGEKCTRFDEKCPNVSNAMSNWCFSFNP